jgi:hypothetical protein
MLLSMKEVVVYIETIQGKELMAHGDRICGGSNERNFIDHMWAVF